MVPLLIVGIFVPDIQKLVRYTGGYLGIVVLVIIPVVLIIGSRFW